ncbi:MAG: protein-L-isoaspartate(D-aspartate) O-methyltransferase [Saprospiraceae bacterium]|nr:protein-L-isoaspartate(D-aspartate) O-methyltransferase [Saprospiraceae bacterium]
MKDSYIHQGLRSKLITTLRSKGIKDERILSAFMHIPRHLFLDSAFAKWAYTDVAFPIDSDQTISQPYTVAVQTSLLKIKGVEKVLEIGTGSGFQACVLSYLGAKVYTIERQEKLFHKTVRLLDKLGFGRIRTLLGDGYKGAPRFAPFDRILITCGAPFVPQDLLDQLKIGGIMVVPLGEGDVQRMIRITKVSPTKFEQEDFGAFKFVPFLEGVNRSKKI